MFHADGYLSTSAQLKTLVRKMSSSSDTGVTGGSGVAADVFLNPGPNCACCQISPWDLKSG